jgi:hypothetical protein
MHLCYCVFFQDEEFDVVSFSQNKRPGYTAPAALLNDIAQVTIELVLFCSCGIRVGAWMELHAYKIQSVETEIMLSLLQNVMFHCAFVPHGTCVGLHTDIYSSFYNNNQLG